MFQNYVAVSGLLEVVGVDGLLKVFYKMNNFKGPAIDRKPLRGIL